MAHMNKEEFCLKWEFSSMFPTIDLRRKKRQSANRKNVDTKKNEECAYCLQMGRFGDIRIHILCAWECPGGVSATSFRATRPRKVIFNP
ncbi:hypothetical protein AVEN_89927-1 [Araneus ventricosus]|uniref:Uncharacterized protein n=1 Tax=Araneus ventricosus TaxID=182803 RepID=A0A4Y2NZ27_ARAVE|nr:hypothetical protein AVEN_89927-1 [Araneus ventricosus]